MGEKNEDQTIVEHVAVDCKLIGLILQKQYLVTFGIVKTEKLNVVPE